MRRLRAGTRGKGKRCRREGLFAAGKIVDNALLLVLLRGLFSRSIHVTLDKLTKRHGKQYTFGRVEWIDSEPVFEAGYNHGEA
jgi:hypothetical protein